MMWSVLCCVVIGCTLSLSAPALAKWSCWWWRWWLLAWWQLHFLCAVQSPLQTVVGVIRRLQMVMRGPKWWWWWWPPQGRIDFQSSSEVVASRLSVGGGGAGRDWGDRCSLTTGKWGNSLVLMLLLPLPMRTLNQYAILERCARVGDRKRARENQSIVNKPSAAAATQLRWVWLFRSHLRRERRWRPLPTANRIYDLEKDVASSKERKYPVIERWSFSAH